MRYAYALCLETSMKVFCIKIPVWVSAVASCTNPPKYAEVNTYGRIFCAGRGKKPRANCDHILHRGRDLRHNQLDKFWCRSINGFRRGGEVKFSILPPTGAVALTTFLHYHATV